MLLGTTSLAIHSTPLAGAERDTTMNTFQWLLILGFPLEVAAAKAMPDLFTDTTPAAIVTDGRRVFVRTDIELAA
jgi:hypothetical protein